MSLILCPRRYISLKSQIAIQEVFCPYHMCVQEVVTSHNKKDQDFLDIQYMYGYTIIHYWQDYYYYYYYLFIIYSL